MATTPTLHSVSSLSNRVGRFQCWWQQRPTPKGTTSWPWKSFYIPKASSHSRGSEMRLPVGVCVCVVGYISIPTQRPLKGARTRNVARRAAVCDVMSGRLGLVPSATFQVSRILYSWILRDLIHHPSISKKSAGVVASTDRVEPLPVILFKLWQNSSDSRP